jgi:hypothetical protein
VIYVWAVLTEGHDCTISEILAATEVDIFKLLTGPRELLDDEISQSAVPIQLYTQLLFRNHYLSS